MVKNTKGGSGHKGQARKHVNQYVSKKTRVSEDEMEIYACVMSLLGGANCSVKCVDGETRLCIIRGKFRGARGKRGNTLSRGTWVLVGIREWSSSTGTDKESRKCDLLEVYTDYDKQELKKIRGINWADIDMDDVATEKCNYGEVDFSSSNYQFEYEELLKNSAGENVKLQTTPENDEPDNESTEEEDEEVNIDDI